MLRRATTFLVLTLSFLTTQARGDSITFAINLVVTATEATSIGHAIYDPVICVTCYHWGNHRINGGTASASWILSIDQNYDGRISQAPTAGTCYTGFIEGWGSAGFYGMFATFPEKCAPCVLTLGTSGSGSIAGAPIGATSYTCGTSISLTASPASGWDFSGWTGSITSQDASLSFTLDASKSVTATFVEQPPPPPCTSCSCTPQGCEQSESCPLILDLNGDGIHTTGLDDPVHFWIDLQGRSEATAWTDPNTEEAFLWMDLNNDHTAQVTELFGSRMIAHGGNYHAQGFEALAKYDWPSYGGDGDGQITKKDQVWRQLLLWVDRNHDGASQASEISTLKDHRILALNLAYTEGDTYDEHGNELYLVGSYELRPDNNDDEGKHEGANKTVRRLMADVEFKFIAN